MIVIATDEELQGIDDNALKAETYNRAKLVLVKLDGNMFKIVKTTQPKTKYYPGKLVYVKNMYQCLLDHL